MQAELQSVTDKFFATRAELDMLQLQLNPSVGGAAGEEGATPGGGGGGRGAASNELLRTYLGRIADLEKEVRGGGLEEEEEAGGGDGGKAHLRLGGEGVCRWSLLRASLPPVLLSSVCLPFCYLTLPSPNPPPIHPFLPDFPPQVRNLRSLGQLGPFRRRESHGEHPPPAGMMVRRRGGGLKGA